MPGAKVSSRHTSLSLSQRADFCRAFDPNGTLTIIAPMGTRTPSRLCRVRNPSSARVMRDVSSSGRPASDRSTTRSRRPVCGPCGPDQADPEPAATQGRARGSEIGRHPNPLSPGRLGILESESGWLKSWQNVVWGRFVMGGPRRGLCVCWCSAARFAGACCGFRSTLGRGLGGLRGLQGCG